MDGHLGAEEAGGGSRFSSTTFGCGASGAADAAAGPLLPVLPAPLPFCCLLPPGSEGAAEDWGRCTTALGAALEELSPGFLPDFFWSPPPPPPPFPP